MSDRLAAAMTKTGTIAAGYLTAWVYRCQSQGDSLSPQRVLFGVVLFFLSFAVALAWQGISKVRYWSRGTTFLGFTLSMVVVCIAVVTAIRSIS
jgi:hypothetical protein